MRVQKIVIVGASLAGTRAAEMLRSGGFAGEIVMVGNETQKPYDRPPLSKNYLAGDWDDERVALRKPEAVSYTHLTLPTILRV